MAILYTTCPTRRTAQRLGDALLTQRLIACYNLWPLSSRYWWKGKMVREREVAMLMKTPLRNAAKVKRLVLKLHPYKTPCVSVVSTRRTNRACAAWLDQECQ